MKNVANRKLHHPLAIPSSQELAVMARLEQRLAPTTSEPTDKPNIGVCGAATLPLLTPSGTRANPRET